MLNTSAQTNHHKKSDSAYYYYSIGVKNSRLNNSSTAYKNYLKARCIYSDLLLDDSIAKCDLKLYSLLRSQKELDINPIKYLNSYYQLAIKQADTNKLINAYYKFGQHYWDSLSRSATYYKKALILSKIKERKKTQANIFSNLAFLYSEKKKDSAQIFFNKALDFYGNNHPTELFSTYINYASFFQESNDWEKAINQLNIAKKITPNKYRLKLFKVLFLNLSNCYTKINDYENAYINYKSYNNYRDSLNNSQQNIEISKIKEQYDNEKLRANNLEIESKRKQNRNLFYGALVFLFLGGTIGFLFLKNSRKKRLLAEQQKELEKQKNLTLLKEQEITSINAMVIGQEKERIRIAEDLHDNIGSVLATLKLHFENLKLNREKKHFNQDDLYEKTEKLIDETYLKVRSIAHAKNAGVIAHKGLLVAVKLMAEKISDANKIKIHVLDFGLDKRLENKLEITVFRIIQELITNIIKHAEATETTINITLYDQNLNIIIEDNGKGFNYNKTVLKEGIGLSSIQTRLKHLNGTFAIDSTINKGTSIIIDFPISNT